MKKIVLTISSLCLLVFVTESCKKKDDVSDVVEGCTNLFACNYNLAATKDNGTCTLATTWYQDIDGDGLGNSAIFKSDCNQPSGYVNNATDDFDVSVEKKQRATVTYVGATWCPPCGSYGDPTKINMEITFGSDVVILNSQNGDAITPVGQFGEVFGNAFQNYVSSNSIPHAYWSGFNFQMVHRGFYSSGSSNNSAAATDINNILNVVPEVGIGALAKKTANTITVQTQTLFYNAVSTTRYISVYLLEDSVMASQSFASPLSPAVSEHNNVLRATSVGATGALGLNTMGATFTLNQKVNGTYTINYNSAWNAAKLQVAVVVWSGTTANKISNSIIVNVN